MSDLKLQIIEFNAQQNEQFSTTDVIALLHQRSDFYDETLLNLWQEYGFSDRQDLALIAVGGYGRREMFPLSDLDILVLTENPLDEQTHAKLNELFNLLWDAKLQVGASIRTLQECLDIGKQELSVATNMYEGRLLYGNAELWHRLVEALFKMISGQRLTFSKPKWRKKKSVTPVIVIRATTSNLILNIAQVDFAICI